HLDRTGKRRDVEASLSGAVGPDGDDAGIERERGLRRRATLQLAGAAVATSADLPLGTLHAVDQLAVKVSDLGRQLALPEEVILGRGRVVIGEVEDADIHRRRHDPRYIARGESGNLDRHAERGLRPDAVRQIHGDAERVRRLVDGEPGNADDAAWHALG